MERITEKGTERLVDKQGNIETWVLVKPAQDYLERLAIAGEAQRKEERKIELIAQIKALEEGILYSMINGDEVWVENKKAQRTALKQELRAL